jgi:hypothetical protein
MILTFDFDIHPLFDLGHSGHKNWVMLKDTTLIIGHFFCQ